MQSTRNVRRRPLAIAAAATLTAGRTYRQTSGFSLETQHFPDTPHHIGQAGWPSVVRNAGNTFTSTTTYKFTTAGHGLHVHF
jgi:aldose 1-epimerase